MNIVEQDISRFGDDIEDFTGDLSYQRSTAKCIEEIGGAAKRLTSDVTSRYRDIDWSAVCGMRDVLVHLYDRIDPS